jgi:hypothetical protein
LVAGVELGSLTTGGAGAVGPSSPEMVAIFAGGSGDRSVGVVVN